MAEAMILSSTCNRNLNVFSSTHNSIRRRAAAFSSKSAMFWSSGVSYPLLNLRSGGLKTSSLRCSDLSGAGMFGVGGATGARGASNAQMSIGIGKAQKWWEKGIQPNMKEVTGAQELVDSLSSAGDKLVVLDFFSPGCGGCKALHPKICQLAGMNPDVQFLQVNYEEHKSMCYSLNVHVLPFFRFYGGAEGRVCSFSCTNATIKKFKDALAKYGQDRCWLGPPKGLEEKELLALAANRDLSFTYTAKREEPLHVSAEEETRKEAAPASPPPPLSLPLSLSSTSPKAAEETIGKSLVNAGR